MPSQPPSQPPRRDIPLTDFGLLPGERPAVPQAEITDTQGSWDDFERFSRDWKPPGAAGTPAPPHTAPAGAPPRAERAFLPTEPAHLPRVPSPTAPASDPGKLTLEQALAEARRFNRVCPRPQHWQQLYEMLPNKVTIGHDPHPAPPIRDTAWRSTPALPKRLCLRDHLAWAESQGVLDEVMGFLNGLREEDWHHMGD